MSSRELKRGTLEMILLKLISARQMYGYELVTALEEQGEGQFQLKEGTLYPVLYRLEDKGWIKSRWEAKGRGVPRKYYTLTESGADQLDELISGWREFSTVVNRLLTTEVHSK